MRKIGIARDEMGCGPGSEEEQQHTSQYTVSYCTKPITVNLESELYLGNSHVYCTCPSVTWQLCP